jgi:hypothetical protein
MPATDFQVSGPTTIAWTDSTNFVNLGFTDNEDLIRISATNHSRSFSRNDQGDMIGEAVMSGTTFTIDFTLVSWDQAELVKLISKVRSGTASANAADEGLFATVGGTVVNGATSRRIGLRITPTTSGQIVYSFPRVMLASGPEYLDFGNTLKRVALSFVTLAPASGTTVVTTSAVP